MDETLNLDLLTVEQLEDFSKTIQTSNEQIERELLVLETHCNRVCSSNLLMKASNSSLALSDVAKGNAFNQSENDLRVNAKKKKGDFKKNDLLMLTLEQKYDICLKELDEFKYFNENQNDEFSKDIDNYKAEIECAEITLAELKKESFEFKRHRCYVM